MVNQGFLNLPKDEQEKILEAALDEFSQKDYDSASINQIIQNAGISKFALYVALFCTLCFRLFKVPLW